MSESKEPHNDERIEELLSQLQGIFSKLSTSEAGESKQKLDLPSVPEPPKTPEPLPSAPPSAPAAPTAPKRNEPSPLAGEPPSPPELPPAAPPPVNESPESLTAPFEMGPVESVESPQNIEANPPEVAPSLDSPPLTEAPAPVPKNISPAEANPDVAAEGASLPQHDDSAISIAIFYPDGLEADGKSLAEKIELISPKFTKVTFHLSNRLLAPYSPKSDWKEGVLTRVKKDHIRALFLVTERSLEEAKRKAIVSELEACGIYFQEVPLVAIPKRAFYTDMLLGMVFFFDSQKLAPKNTQE